MLTGGATGTGRADGWLIKINGQGNVVWSKTYGTSSRVEHFKSAHVATDGSIILSGFSYYTEGNKNYVDLFLVKVDAQGNEVLSRVLGEDETDDSRSVRQASDV